MHLRLALVTYLQTPKAVEPTVRALYHPAVAAQLLTAVHAPTGNAVLDAALLQGYAQCLTIVAFVRMNLHRTARKWDRVNRLDEHFAVGSVSRRAEDRQWQAVTVYHKMALRALFAAIRRVRSRGLPPFGAVTRAESTEARSQSMRPASSSLVSKVSCKVCQTPASCQSRRRRQQVVPEPQPISAGSIFHGMPVLKTNRMPPSAARFEMRGLPPKVRSGTGGRSGSTSVQRSSGTSGFAMPLF